MIILYILLAILGLLFVITLLRFILLKKQAISVDLDINQDLAHTYGQKFQTMVQVKTLSYNQHNKDKFIELKNQMKALFPYVFQTMTIKTFEDESLLLHWKGKKNNRPMVLMSHLDVVDVDEDKWDYPPFSGHIDKGQIYGRGTLDTKSTVFAFYQACEDLIKNKYQAPEQDIYLFSSTNEEVSGDGAKIAVDYLESKGVQPFIVLDEGGAIVTGGLPSVDQALAMVGIIEKGYANIKFKAKSSGGHSSTPPKHTPIARLSAFVHHVENHFPLKTKMIPEVTSIFKVAAPYMKGILRYLFINMWLFKPLITWLLPKLSPYGRALLSTTIAFTQMKGSDQENVIPSEASVTANCRIHPIQDVDHTYQVLKELAQTYDIEAELLMHRNPSDLTDIHGDAYQYLKQIILMTFKDVKVSPYVMLGSTDCRHFNRISQGALRFSPIRLNQEELKKMHGHNESIRLDTLVQAVEFYQNIIKHHQ